MLRSAIFLSLTLILACTQLWAHDYQLQELEINHPWARPTPPNARVGGGFLTITNHGQQNDRLVSVQVGFADRVEIHQTQQDGELSRMVHLPDGLPLPAGASRELAPGGYHLMFMGLHHSLDEGEKVSAELVFELAGSITVEFHIENRTGADHSEHNHSHDHSHNH